MAARTTTTTTTTAKADKAARKAPAKSAKATPAKAARKAAPVADDDSDDDSDDSETGVNQWAREQARAADKPASNATRRYTALALALAELAKPGQTVSVRFAAVNKLTGSTRGEREGCDVSAQWRRGVKRLHDVFGTDGLARVGIAGVSVADDGQHLSIVGTAKAAK